MSTWLKHQDYIGLRKRCVEMHQSGTGKSAIAKALGRAPSWVTSTLGKYNQGGITALEGKKPSGAPPKLDPDQVQMLITELEKGAQAHGFAGELWTRKRVNIVIQRKFNTSYDESQTGRILKKVGWSKQRPQRKARQQRPQDVGQWKQEDLPEIKKNHGRKDG